MDNLLIEIDSLTKVYTIGQVETKALKRIDLQVTSGEFISIMGTSGCGKSTLLNIIGMLDNATAGSYRFKGEDVTKYHERKCSKVRKGNIGFVFQNFNLIDTLTVYENVELPLVYLKYKSQDRRKKIKEILGYMNIYDLRERFPYQLSGGQQQRIALARAVVFNPALILADEPTGNLDHDNSHHIMSLLKQLNSDGKTIILVTHEKEFADYAANVITLSDGRILSNYINS